MGENQKEKYEKSKRESLLSEGSVEQSRIVSTQNLWETRVADAILAATGASGSLAVLQYIQEQLVANDLYKDVTTPIVGGFLAGSSIKFFLNQTPPSLEAFFKSTVAGIVIGSSIHSFLWTRDSSEEPMPTLSRAYSNYLVLFCMILFWKLDVGSIWGAGNSLAMHIAFQSGFWGQNLSSKGSIHTLLYDFPFSYILRPYLIGHVYLYVCAHGVAKLRRRVRIYLLRKDIFSMQKERIREDKGFVEELKADRSKLRRLFGRIDTSGDGRLDAMELKLALRAAVGVDLTIDDCKYMIRSVDCDGDGTIDFEEFCASVDQLLFLR